MRLSTVLLILALAAPARAHVGAMVSRAKFTAPALPTATASDGGVLDIAPYTFATADTSFTVSWTVDYPNDPTGRFEFFYLDHQLPSQYSYDQAIGLMNPIPEASGNNLYWISCTCTSVDGGVTCPDAGTRTYCNLTSFVWNTTNVPAGTYWIYAFNADPPFKIFSSTDAPIRIAHGGATLPPAVEIVLPDGIGSFDQKMTAQWLTAGTPPFKFDLSYGNNDPASVTNPPTSLATNATVRTNPDGSYLFDLDVSQFKNGPYYLRVKVTDGTGASAYTDSFYGFNVYHPPEDGGDLAPAPSDAALDMPLVLQPLASDGCSCDVGRAGSSLPLAGLALAALLLVVVRRRAR